MSGFRFRVHRLADHPLVKPLLAMASDTIIYLVGTGLVGVGNMALVAVFTRSLPPRSFGTLALLEIAIQIAILVSQLGYTVSYLKWFADLKPSRHGDLLGSSLAVNGVTGALAGAVLAAYFAGSAGVSVLGLDERAFLWMILPIIAAENMQGIMLTDLRARRRAVAFGVCSFVRIMAVAAASVWFVVVRGGGVEGVIAGRLAGTLVSAGLLGLVTLRGKRLGFSWALTAPMLRFGIPMIWSGVFWMLLDGTGRFFLGRYSSLEEVGLYGVAVKISAIFDMAVMQPFGTAWGGMMFQITKMPRGREVYARLASIVMAGSMCAAVLIVLAGPLLFRVMAPPVYHAAIGVLPFILLARVVRMMQYPLSAPIYVAAPVRYLAVIWAAGFLACLAANFALVPGCGMYGAALGWGVGEAVIAVLLVVVGRRFYPVPYETGTPALALLFFAAVTASRGMLYASAPLAITAAVVTVGVTLAMVVKMMPAGRRGRGEATDGG